MLPFGVTIPATVPQRSEFPEGLMNYPIRVCWLHLVGTPVTIDVFNKSKVLNEDRACTF